MNFLTSAAVPLILALTALTALSHRTDLHSALTKGAQDGLTILLRILPNLICLMTAISMLRASGFLDWMAAICAPMLKPLGIPPETLPLLFSRPVSGSGALGVGAELIATYGPDSLIGRTAAVMLGSTETTFYTISVYFGAAGIKKTRYALPAALCADFAGFVAASLAVRIFF